MKHIKVESCAGCPYCHYSFVEWKKVLYCTEKPLNGGFQCIDDSSVIPDWCPLESLPEWISVKDRLPEDGEYVLAYVKKSGSHIMYYSKSNKSWGMSGMLCGWIPSFWQPLPSPPKEDEG
jgi:hypothetical protein